MPNLYLQEQVMADLDNVIFAYNYFVYNTLAPCTTRPDRADRIT